MAAPIGVDTVTSISRSYIVPEIVDNVYRSNPLIYRIRASQRMIPGGTHIELPLMYARFAAGGPYSGLDVLNIVPSDTVRNARWDWKQHYVPVVIDGLTLLKSDSPQAIANQIRMLFQQAEEEMAENLAAGLYSDGTSNPKDITGLQLAVSGASSYAQLLRSTYTFWSSQVDSTSTILSLAALQSLMGSATEGGHSPTLIVSQQANYNRYWNLAINAQMQQIGAGGQDDQLAALGFRNLLFNGIPWVVDSHVNNNSTIYMLNEDYIFLGTSSRADMYLEDFQTPINQDALVAKLLWAGELIVQNCARQAKFTAITS
jgi:hypothetical protein